MLTVGNLTANVSYTLSRKLFGRGVRTLGMLPLGHIYGFVLDMLAPSRQAPISRCSAISPLPRYSPRRFRGYIHT